VAPKDLRTGSEPWTKVVEFTAPDAKWFVGGTTNLCYNCVDRHVETATATRRHRLGGRADPRAAPEVRHLHLRRAAAQTAKFANALKSLGVKKGDVVTIYMGMVPELAIACLACARIGAVHSVIFGGFSATPSSTASRTPRAARSSSPATARGAAARRRAAQGQRRRRGVAALKSPGGRARRRREALRQRPSMTHGRARCLVARRGRAQSPDCPCEPLDSEDDGFLLYTSGSTGKPKGIQHTVGGYMVHTYLTSKYVFNLTSTRPRARPGGRTLGGQVYWCTADVGWITGHSYIIYGVMPNRVPTLMYEGAPNAPRAARFWDIVERHKVTQFYTAPTAIRAFMKWGDEHIAKHDLTSSRCSAPSASRSTPRRGCGTAR
jgi:acetyl-CoA synthetase